MSCVSGEGPDTRVAGFTIVGSTDSAVVITDSLKAKKNLFDKKRPIIRSNSYLSETVFCRSWHLPSREVAVASKGQSLSHSG